MTWESNLLRQWFETLALEERVWEQWVQFMEPEPTTEIPEELRIEKQLALELYLQSHNWLYSL